MKEGLVCQIVWLVLSISVTDASPFISRTLNNTVERIDANRDWVWLTGGGYELRLMEGETRGDWQCCVSVCSASVLQAMAVLVCAEMYQVKRLQHLCEVCVCAYLQNMPSRELASTGISVIRLLKKAKVSLYISISIHLWYTWSHLLSLISVTTLTSSMSGSSISLPITTWSSVTSLTSWSYQVSRLLDHLEGMFKRIRTHTHTHTIISKARSQHPESTSNSCCCTQAHANHYPLLSKPH